MLWNKDLHLNADGGLTGGAAGDAVLLQVAWEARDRAYAPYSSFKVGAALRTTNGRIFSGCNVENLSYGLTMCAERVAIGKAIAAGEKEFETVLIVADSTEPVTPCGACRQVIAEFGSAIVITSVNRQGASYTATVEQLLPRSRAGILG